MAFGAAVLLHGLTDSPYSMRAPGQLHRDHGFIAIANRLPGHGTLPGPMAIITGLATSVLEFNLRASPTDRADWLGVGSDLAVKIRDGRVQAGIEVPLAQRIQQAAPSGVSAAKA